MASMAPTQPRKNAFPTLAMIALIIIGFGSASGLLAGSSDSLWYQTLRKPSFNPPGYLFGIVWPILYTMMSLSVWMIWRLPDSALRSRALTLFTVQLLVNYAWSFVFFTFHQIALGAIWIGVMGFLVLTTVLVFRRLNALAAALLLPYLAWVTFAFVLNSSIWMLNSGG